MSYVNLSGFFAGVRLGGQWVKYEKVVLKAAAYRSYSTDRVALVLYGDGLRRDGRWERTPLTNIVLEDVEGLEQLLALIFAFVTVKRGLDWTGMREYLYRLQRRASSIVTLLYHVGVR